MTQVKIKSFKFSKVNYSIKSKKMNIQIIGIKLEKR